MYERHTVSRRRNASRASRASASLRRTPLAVSVSALIAATAIPLAALAQDGPIEELLVTATRRSESVQDIPINITAFGGDTLARREITDLAELGRNVPGLYVVDQGKRTANQVVVRGLNLDPVTASEFLGNDGGEVVSTYVGDIPLYVDLELNDMERVEVLLGPQGTLYGAGTLGGAIRYLPRRPELGTTSYAFRAGSSVLAESDDFGMNGGLTANFPLGDNLALRLNLDRDDSPGFIDAPFLVNTPGVSDPEPDFSSPAAVAANLHRVDDVNSVDTTAARVGLRWQATDNVDANFTYYYQNVDAGGRNQNNVVAFGTGKYVSSTRYREPNERENKLAALEITADLGFAELTSATGYSTYADAGQRDQTDLLITLNYGYELFPSFSAYTFDDQHDRRLNQELRLVSNGTGKLSWIVGSFYNNKVEIGPSREYAPNFAEYLGGSRPDALEYYSYERDETTERAIFGEIGYEITDDLKLTVGGRFYDYDLTIQSGVTFPLISTVFGDPPLPPGETGIEGRLENAAQSADGNLYKVNVAYDFTDDVLGYVTISEGFRLGASNGIGACSPDDDPDEQAVCALPDEVQYFPDTTTNYEVGVRSQWLDGRLTINGALYFIDWKDPQLASATLNAAQPITKNGSGAESKGLELSIQASITDRLDVGVSFAHTQAELSDFAPALLRNFVPPGFGPYDNLDPDAYVDGQPGDRLPGSPENQGTFTVNYSIPTENQWIVDVNYGFSAIGDIITKPGLRANGQRLGGYAVHFASATASKDQWTFGVYAQNLLNKFAVTGTRSIPIFAQTVEDENGDPVRVRSFGQDVLRPREIGFRFSYSLDR